MEHRRRSCASWAIGSRSFARVPSSSTEHPPTTRAASVPFGPMRASKTPADRFLELVDQRLAPALSPLGFERRRSVLARELGDVRWLIEVELAPWTSTEKVAFTLAWGVTVPGLAEVLGDGP